MILQNIGGILFITVYYTYISMFVKRKTYKPASSV